MTKGFYIGVLTAAIALLVEFIMDQREHQRLYKKKDTRNNLIIGALHVGLGTVNRSIVYVVYCLVYRFHLWNIETTLITGIIALIAWDFSFYWYHRSAHSVNWFWASHSVHHSSEQYNLSVAFRQSWVQTVSGSFLFKIWMPVIGFDPLLLLIVESIGMGYQSWLHSELIPKLHPWFEWMFNTPSHHRVHHASDIKYLDKNHGGMFIIWDRIFGTYHDEEEKPAYGLTTSLQSQKVSFIMWNYWSYLFKRIASSTSVIIGAKYLVAAPGWSHDKSTLTVKEMRTGSTAPEHNVKPEINKCNGCMNLNCSKRMIDTSIKLKSA